MRDFATMQAFDNEFDYVKSYEVPAGVRAIEWLNKYGTGSNRPSFLAANDKRIRLFRIRNTRLSDDEESMVDELEDSKANDTFENRFRADGKIVFP